MFRYLIEELNYDVLELDDFSSDSVELFVTLLADKKLGDVEEAQFRELHKLATVFEVEWLEKESKEWLECRMKGAETDEEKKFVFEESLYILNKWEQRNMMQALLYIFVTKNNASFVSQYIAHLDTLDTVQLDLMLILGGNNSELFIDRILMNLEGKKELDLNTKHLLSHMNLALSFEQNKELYLAVCRKIQDLSDISMEDMKLAFQLSTETMRSVSSRSEERKTRIRTTMVEDYRMEQLLNSCETIKGIPVAILDNRVKSMFRVVDMLLWVVYKNTPNTEDTQILITTLENVCRERKIQKVSKQYLEMIINVLNYSPLPQRVQLITLLNEIKDNNKLSTYHENIHINKDKFIIPGIGQKVLGTIKHFMKGDRGLPAGAVYKIHYKFKHPFTVRCTESGTCGFIIRVHYGQDKTNWNTELSINSEDYEGTGLHLHDIISARDMSWYGIYSGNIEPDKKIQVAGGRWWEEWLPNVTDWKIEQLCIAYNVSEYVVTKQDKFALND